MFFKHFIQTSSIKSNSVKSIVYLIQDLTKNSNTKSLNAVRTKKIVILSRVSILPRRALTL